MKKTLTCIECPSGCQLEVNMHENTVVSVSGNKCPKGNVYAEQELVCPMRILTTAVRAEGLVLKMIPVRSEVPIPKEKIRTVATVLRTIVIKKPCRCGDVVYEEFAGSGVRIIVTRSVAKK